VANCSALARTGSRAAVNKMRIARIELNLWRSWVIKAPLR
jgi:hypothetical protein